MHIKNNEDLLSSNDEKETPSQFREMKLLKSRTVLLSEAVSSKTAERVISDLLIYDQISNEKITIYINSPGGEVNSGFAIFDAIRLIESKVQIINVGLCASIATIINLAVPKNRRFATKNSRFLIHQPHIPGQIQGQASDLEITAKEILKTREQTNKVIAEECGQKIEKVKEDTIRDFWMSATEAKAYGLISKIISNKKEIN